MVATARSFEDNQPSRRLQAIRQIPPRILIVEDDLELKVVMDRVLDAIAPGAEVDWVTSTEEAMDLLRDRRFSTGKRSKPYDLLIADIFLEGESTGLDLYRLCQQELFDMPIMVTSGMSAEKFFQAVGPNMISPPFLQKPFLYGECAQMIQGVLDYQDA